MLKKKIVKKWFDSVLEQSRCFKENSLNVWMQIFPGELTPLHPTVFHYLLYKILLFVFVTVTSP